MSDARTAMAAMLLEEETENVRLQAALDAERAARQAAEAELSAARAAGAELKGRLEGERAERAKADALVSARIAALEQRLNALPTQQPIANPAKGPDTWKFAFIRDGADKLLDIVATRGG